MESEYMALFEAAQLAKQLRDLLTHLGAEQRSPTKIFEDNEACATIANPRSYTRRARHIDVRFHFTREAVEQGIIELTRIATNDQLADILTKNLPSPQLSKLRNLLMGQSRRTDSFRLRQRYKIRIFFICGKQHTTDQETTSGRTAQRPQPHVASLLKGAAAIEPKFRSRASPTNFNFKLRFNRMAHRGLEEVALHRCLSLAALVSKRLSFSKWHIA
jgi:hypothetical protein